MPEIKPKEVFRLSPAMYAEVEKQVPNTFVTSTTTEIQAAFQLGVQHVLKVLRDGFTSGT